MYELQQVPYQRIEDHPTVKQYFMAVAPTLYIFLSSSTTLLYAYQAKGVTSLEKDAPSLSTLLSSLMILFEIVVIFYPTHERFEIIQWLMGIVFRINLVQLILSASFISYESTTDDYMTYFTWIYVCTVPIVLLTAIPFFTDCFRCNYS